MGTVTKIVFLGLLVVVAGKYLDNFDPPMPPMPPAPPGFPFESQNLRRIVRSAVVSFCGIF